MSKYKTTWTELRQHMNEMQLAYVVRYLDPKNGKRFAVPFKTQPDANKKRDQLKRDGAQQLSITKDYLKGKFKEEVSKDGAYAIGMAKAKDMYNDEKPVDKKTITKAHDIAKAILRKEEVISEELLIEWDKEEQLQEFSRSQLDALARQYADMKGKTISIDNANKLRKIFDRIPDAFLNDLRKRHIPFLSGLALSRMIKKGIPVREDKELKEGRPSNPLSTTGATRQPTSKSDKLYLTNPKEHRRRQELEFTYKRILATMGARANSREGKIAAMDLARVRSAKTREDLAKNMKHKGTLKIAEDINERYSVKFSYSKGGKIANAYYDDKEEADKFVKSVIAKGGKAIMTMENVGDYLKSKLNPTQIQNIKKTWQNKKASDVTPAVKAHIKNMDIPTQLAIKQANIPHISKLVEETIVEFTTQQIKQAYGIANDPRYKGGNYDGAVKAIEKIAKGLSKHPDVAKVLKRTNEDASNMAQAKATGTQKRIADLTTSIRDKETRARDINPSDKTKMAIHKADMNHMRLKLADLKDKLRMDRQKRAMAAQNEPETDTSGKPNNKKEITENE